MRLLIAVIALALLGWSGFWFLGREAFRNTIESQLYAAASRGWTAEISDLRIRGFPNRLDATLERPSLTDPSGQFSWTAPFLQLFTLSYRPSQLLLVWPESQTLDLGGDRIVLETEEMKASVDLGGIASPRLDEMIVEFQRAAFSDPEGGAVRFGQSLFAIRRTESEAPEFDVALSLVHHPDPLDAGRVASSALGSLTPL